MTTVVRIDNANNRVSYSGTWAPQYNDNDALNRTITLARDVGCSASISFTGTKIAVYGVLGKMDPPVVPHITTYDLDNLPTATFAPSPPANPPLKQLRWWESPELEYGEHKLTMTNTQDKAWIWFDYFEVMIPQNTPSSSSSLTPNLNSNPTVTPPASHKSTSVGAIVGAILGGVAAALLITGLAFYLFWKRKKRSKVPHDLLSDGGDEFESARVESLYRQTAYRNVTAQAYESPSEPIMSSYRPRVTSSTQPLGPETNPLIRPVISGTILPSKMRHGLSPSPPAEVPALPAYSE